MTLSTLRRTLPFVSGQTRNTLIERGLLSFPEPRKNWRFGDHANGCTRALNPHSNFKCADNRGDHWHKLIGLLDVIDNARQFVIFVLEGSKDAVAALELAHRAGLLAQVGIVAALGAGYRPIASEIKQLRGRKVFLIGDRDSTGMEAVRLVSHALTEHEVDHAVWNWNAFDPNAGKDLCELLEHHHAQKGFLAPSRNLFFLFFFPSNSSTVQQFNGSTHTVSTASSKDFNSSTHVLELVEPFIVRNNGTGNRQSFLLARALRSLEEATKTFFMDAKIDEIFHCWFVRSQPLLPPGADKEKSLAHFYKQMRRVRYPPCALDAALKRANTLPLPDIAGLDTNALRVAALMRELQREAGEKSFICPVNVIVRFVPLRFAEQARRILFVLEQTHIIECVDRGAPHIPGKPGKPTVWRYMKTLIANPEPERKQAALVSPE